MDRKDSLTVSLERRGPFDPDAIPVREARAQLRTFYRAQGYADAATLLTAPASQTKLAKSKVPAYGLTLAAAAQSDWEACLWRTPECSAMCVLRTGGRSVFANVARARIMKTNALGALPEAFVVVLAHEIRAAVRRHGGRVDVRLNVASDLRWERFAPALLEIPGARFYDYTKAPASQRTVAPEYHLTYSVSERPHAIPEALEWLRSGGNAAVVFERMTRADWDGILPSDWESFPVIDGDLSDGRSDDPAGVVVGLRAKGAGVGVRGRADGFVKPGA